MVNLAREGMDVVAEKPEPLTQDLLIDINKGLEMQYWMFQAQA